MSDDKAIVPAGLNGTWAEMVDRLAEEMVNEPLPDKVIRAAELLVSGYPIQKTAAELKVTAPTVRRWLSTYPTLAAIVADRKKQLVQWRMGQLEEQFLKAIGVSRKVLDTDLTGFGVDPKTLTVVAAQARYIIGLFAGQKVDVQVTHELGETVLSAKRDALDYLASRLAEQRGTADTEPIEAVYRVIDEKIDNNAPLLDERGNPPFGKLGEYTVDDGGTQCHLCGSYYKDLYKHVLLKHGMGSSEYEIAYMLDESSLKKISGSAND